MEDQDEVEKKRFADLLNEANAKLRDAEKAWYAAFCAAPVGGERVMAAAVYARIRNAKIRPF